MFNNLFISKQTIANNQLEVMLQVGYTRQMCINTLSKQMEVSHKRAKELLLM